MPLSIYQIQEIINHLEYKDWKFIIGRKADSIYLQVGFQAPDNERPNILQWQKGRKWLLSTHMTRSEIVQTALKAVLTAEEHEAREQFKYKGATPFAPHFDIEILTELAGHHHAVDVREPGQNVADEPVRGQRLDQAVIDVSNTFRGFPASLHPVNGKPLNGKKHKSTAVDNRSPEHKTQ